MKKPNGDLEKTSCEKCHVIIMVSKYFVRKKYMVTFFLHIL